MSTDDPTTGARTLSSPTAEAAADLVADGIEASALVTLFGRCTVDYEGRAASELGPGDRHVMLKPDGAALVHTDEGGGGLGGRRRQRAGAGRRVVGGHVLR